MSTYLDLDAIYNSTSGGGFTAGGDLSGSSTNQTVIALYGYNLSNATPSSGQALVWNSGTSKWSPTTLSSGSFAAGGDLSGSDTSQTVIALRGTSLHSSIASVGAVEDGYALVWENASSSWKAKTITVDLSSYALKATTISAGTGLTGGGNLSANRTLSVDFGTTGTTVCVGNDSRLSDSRAPNGSAGGDLSSTYPNPTVNKIQGKSLNAAVGTVGASEDGYVLTWDNSSTSWKPTLPPSGSFIAGGDLSGNSSSQTVEKIKGTVITTAGGALAVGAVLRTTAVGIADWGALDLADTDAVTGVLPTGNQASQTMAGDVSGTTAASQVDKLKTKALASALSSIGATQDGYVLTWVDGSTEWQAKPTATTVTSLPMTGDVGGTTDANTVNKIKGTTITTAGGALAVGAVLRTTAVGTADWGQLDLADSDAVTGVLPKANQGVQDLVGDVSGNTGASVVDKIKGKSLNALVGTVGASEDGYALIWDNGTSTWKPASVSVDLTPYALKTITISAGTGLTGGGDLSANRSLAVDFGTSGTTVCVGNDSRLSDSRAPNGSASGDLSGSYPGPTVAKVNATTITTAGGALSTGAVLRVTGASSADWGALDLADTDAVTGVLPKGNQGVQDMVGDVSGNTGASVVDKLKGKALNANVGTVGVSEDGYVLTWDNSSTSWKAKQASGGGSGVTTVAAIDTNANSNGLYISGVNISTQSASASNPGMVNTGSQTFAGTKLFNQIQLLDTATHNLYGSKLETIHSISGNLTVPSDGYNIILVDTTSSAITVTLPSHSGNTGKSFIIKDKAGNAETNNITLARSGGSGNIEGIAASRTLSTNWGTWKVISDGSSNWYIIT